MKAYARYSGACDTDMNIIDTLTAKEFVEHEKLTMWLYWYSMNVLYRAWQPATEALRELAEHSDEKRPLFWWDYYKKRFNIE